MAFFENLTKKASETTAKAMQKAQELSEITRINGLISDEEKKINTAYCEIGKLYVSVHGADGEEGFDGMVDAIHEAEKKIEEHKTQLHIVKGVERCEQCGAEVQRGVAFCSCCGAAMPKVETSAEKVCPSCGTKVEGEGAFCAYCGTKL